MATQRDSSISRHNCSRCSRPLPIQGDRNAEILVSVFPEMAFNCLVHLQYGPGAIPCDSCQYINHRALPQAILGADVQGLLYMPETIESGSTSEQRAIAVFQLHFGRAPIIVRDRRSFRRTSIEMFLMKQIALQT